METKAPDVFARDCASRLVLNRIGDKWSVLVVLALSEGTLRFSQLRARLDGVTPKVLTQTLRTLERDGLITREVFAEVPPRVEYELTEMGMELLVRMVPLWTWIVGNADRFREARQDFDSRQQGGHLSRS